MAKSLRDLIMHNQIISNMGGVNAVAKHFGYSYQRVRWWTINGIPAKTYLDNQKLFDKYKTKKFKIPEL
jgi:hypothetical protein